MPAGRPSDYNEQTIEKTKHYLANYKDYDDVIPSIAGLSVVLGVARNTIYDWASQEDKKEFSNILQDILSTQEKILINKGLDSTFNSNITKLVLGKHGYHDKSETDITSGGKTLAGVDINVRKNESSV